ncbi:hypothetical protein, partial [Sulfolobus sp. B1]|uniref:hypothetical protein n=1 Tax=Sulfolobus sp. B1 TaxID=2200888 RepID=UPI001C8F9DDA
HNKENSIYIKTTKLLSTHRNTIGLFLFELAWGLLTPNLNLLISEIISKKTKRTATTYSLLSFLSGLASSLLLVFLGYFNDLHLSYLIEFSLSLLSIILLLELNTAERQ